MIRWPIFSPKRRPAPPLPSQLRVLHAPHAIAGNAYLLSEYERRLGLKSDLVVFEDSRFQFKRHRSLGLEQVTNEAERTRRLREFLNEAINDYDVFHFNFGSSLLHRYPQMMHEDFPILRAAGKKIFVTYQGCDARDKYFSLKHLETNACAQCAFTSCDRRYNRWKRKSVAYARKFADGIFVLNPDLLNACPDAEFLPYASVDVTKIDPVDNQGRDKIVVLHAPTSRSVKGSEYVLDAFEWLRRRFPQVEIKMIEGLSHEAALAEYRRADIVVDQLLVGWYGAFAVECMAMAKPVLAYLREEDLARLPSVIRDNIGVFNTSKNRLFEDLCQFVESAELRESWAKRGRQFVLEFHDPAKIAARTVARYRGAYARQEVSL